MRNFFKSQKGISLVSLAISVVVILILTNVILYNVKDNLGVQKLKNMQTDIQNLRDKVSGYYSQYGKIPADTNIEYTNINQLKTAGIISEAVDLGKFYVIDLAAIENVTLSYGKDYEKIRTGEVTGSNAINQLEDLYIINGTSHNIFYVAGIELDGEKFYTDYTKEDVDKVPVNLHYMEQIKIPNGFYYVGGTKETGFVISDVKGDDLDNSKHGNQFVWIPVDKQNFEQKFKRTEGYAKGELDSKVNNCGEADNTGTNNKVAETTKTQQEAIKMYESVKENGGFYIARYEAGKESIEGVEKVVSKKNVAVYNNIPWSTSNTEGAVDKARKMSVDNGYTDVTSTLCYGVQWDAILNFMDPNYITNETSDGKASCSSNSYLVNSVGKGWYQNNYSSGNPNHLTGINVDSQESNKVKNIYDMAGNVLEWTMESYDTNIRISRGGYYDHSGADFPVSSRHRMDPNGSYELLGFRVALYLNKDNKESPSYDKTAIYKDKNEDTAMIPEGFQVSKKTGEDTIQDGLVVIGPDKSEFVWVPVKDINDMSQCSTAGGNCNLELDENEHLRCTTHNSTEIVGKLYATATGERFGTVNTTYNESNGLREPILVNNFDNNTTNLNTVGLTLEGLKNEYKLMAESVAKNGGFYVGRYEASLSDSSETTEATTGNIQSKAGVLPTSSANSANSMWYGLYSKAKTYTTTSVQSSMIWGSQWDAMINWVKNGNGEDKNQVTTSGIGNISSGAVTTTGNSDYAEDSINQIRDLGGNLYEWTVEACDNYARVYRGGQYNFSHSPSYRVDGAPVYTDSGIGSRLSLYIK